MLTSGSMDGIVAIKCIDPTVADWLNTIPPLGTVNYDDEPTQEGAATTCLAGTYKVSQAYEGAFELLYDKSSFTQTDDQESADNNDINTGRNKTKGYENITGKLDITCLKNDNRWAGAIKGSWDYTNRRYSRNQQFRMYEILALTNPSAMNLAATTAEKCVRLIGVKLEKKDLERSQPDKLSIPLFIMRADEFPQWTQATAQTLFTGASKIFAASNNYSVDTAIQSGKIIHTRLKVDIVFTTGGVLTITGLDAFGRKISESKDFTGLASQTWITKNYFASIDASGVRFGTGWAGTTLTVQLTEYDARFIAA